MVIDLCLANKGFSLSEILHSLSLIKLIHFSFLDFWQSCKHESWMGIAKYLMDDVPLLLKSDNVNNIQKVISVIFTSLPSSFEEFIKWVAEVRRREDGGQGLSPEEKARLSVKVL